MVHSASLLHSYVIVPIFAGKKFRKYNVHKHHTDNYWASWALAIFFQKLMKLKKPPVAVGVCNILATQHILRFCYASLKFCVSLTPSLFDIDIIIDKMKKQQKISCCILKLNNHIDVLKNTHWAGCILHSFQFMFDTFHIFLSWCSITFRFVLTLLFV